MRTMCGFLLIAMFLVFCNAQQAVAQDITIFGKLKPADDGEFPVSVAFTPDGKTLASAHQPKRIKAGFAQNDGRLILWNIATKKEIASVDLGPGAAHFVAFSPDGKLLVAAHRDAANSVYKVKIMDAATRAGRHHIVITGNVAGNPNLEHTIRSIAISPDSKTLAIGTGFAGDHSSDLILWDLATGKEKFRRNGGRDQISSLSYTSDGKLLVSCSDDRVQIWDMTTMMESKSFPARRGHSAAISPDGSLIAVATIGSRKYPGVNELIVRDALTGKERVNLGVDKGPPSVLFCPDGKRLIFGSIGDVINVSDATTGKVISTVKGTASFSLATNGNLIASANYDGTISLWDISALPRDRK